MVFLDLRFTPQLSHGVSSNCKDYLGFRRECAVTLALPGKRTGRQGNIHDDGSGGCHWRRIKKRHSHLLNLEVCARPDLSAQYCGNYGEGWDEYPLGFRTIIPFTYFLVFPLYVSRNNTELTYQASPMVISFCESMVNVSSHAVVIPGPCSACCVPFIFD